MRIPAFPRLPLVPDPLRRIRIPNDLDAVTTVGTETDTEGLRPQGREEIWKAAVELYRSGMHPAVQVCVRHQGEMVVDRAIGHARGNGPQDDESAVKVPATPDTPFVTYSCSKAVTAVVVHMLHERGILNIQSPVSEYIPGYGRHGKEKITIAQVLAHRAGVPNLPREIFDLDRAGDRDFLVSALSDARPFASPGRVVA
jgi:CubicO group peptidase (beta-lactamase class C family)